MAGIYIHIPFCKQACHYCDFHFSTNQSKKDTLVNTIVLELKRRKQYLGDSIIKTIYYGGGTPSLLTDSQIDKIQSSIYQCYEVASDVEITFECNPDDLSKSYLQILKNRGINRLSIGVQSFEEAVLKKLNRAHSAKEAKNCISLAQEMGFENITIDLMYGLPDTSITYWQNQIDIAVGSGVKHISAYCLTYEAKTAFGDWLKKGKIIPLTDEHSLEQFKALISSLKVAGFEHYEISNFSIEGYISIHNSNYWLGEKYLGIGPSAHSFNGKSRQWNVSSNAQYVQKINDNASFFEIESLSSKDKFNEYILTRLRTKWGLEKSFLTAEFNELAASIEKTLIEHIHSGYISETSTHYFITEKGKFIADHITSELFVI